MSNVGVANDLGHTRNACENTFLGKIKTSLLNNKQFKTASTQIDLR